MSPSIAFMSFLSYTEVIWVLIKLGLILRLSYCVGFFISQTRKMLQSWNFMNGYFWKTLSWVSKQAALIQLYDWYWTYTFGWCWCCDPRSYTLWTVLHPPKGHFYIFQTFPQIFVREELYFQSNYPKGAIKIQTCVSWFEIAPNNSELSNISCEWSSLFLSMKLIVNWKCVLSNQIIQTLHSISPYSTDTVQIWGDLPPSSVTGIWHLA